MKPKFKSEDIVQRCNQPESVGVVIEPWWDDQTESWNYRVQFGNTITSLPETSLRYLQQVQSVWEKIQNSSFSGIDHFKNTLTFHKLKAPTARVAYAYSTARTLFFPHQFKPLLKFLDNGGKGLLIADDVGLGKTIEAGYIMRELQARRNLERVLVLVPARLGIKWQREMRQRFEEHFDIIKGADLLTLAERIEAGRDLPSFKWIVSYESARPEHVRSALESAQLGIDFLIVDEAHRLRNMETLQHKLGKTLCDLADTSIFLSATPVQNSLDDLWNLLRLLSPDEFPDRDIFTRQIIANRIVLESQRLLSSRPPMFDRAFEKLSEFKEEHEAPVSEPFLQSILDRLAKKTLIREDIAELNSDVARLNILGNIISRTRKSEAMPNCARREAMWNNVELTNPERIIYESVENLCHFGSENNGLDSWGFRMATMMAYRATASCIPAAIEYFEEKLQAKKNEFENSLNYYFEAGELAGESEATRNPKEKDITDWFIKKRDFLTDIVSYWKSEGGVDTKLEQLTSAIREIWEEDKENNIPRRKIVIFSFFRKTLEYLRKSLSERDIGLRMIHGLISLEDRERAIDDFLTRDDIYILLTSEVGGEGIDLQKASVLFNYDLPWNPMVVEQRIGRLDRIGQQADKIVIVNFVVSDSIEEKILQRLLDKIGIFTSTVGEIDPIIGDQIENLTRKALSGVLTSEELEEELEKEEQAIANRTVNARQVQTEADNLFTSDQSLVDEINALTGEQQIPDETELLSFLNRFLAENYPGCQIQNGVMSEAVQVKFTSNLALDMEGAKPELGSDVSLFGRKIASGPILLTISREVGYRHLNADLIHINHPFVKYVIDKLDGKFSSEVFCLKIKHSSVIKNGFYAFALTMLEMSGRKRNKMITVVADLTSDQIWSDSQETNSIILDLLENGENISPDGFPDFDSSYIENRLIKAVTNLKNEIDKRERSLATARGEQRKAIAIQLSDMKLQKAQTRLNNFLGSGAKDFAVKMARIKLKKAQDEFDSTIKYFEEPVREGVESWTDIAVGLLRVGN